MHFLRPQQLRAMRHLDAFGICYVNNPKVACTSVKRVLWLMDDDRRGVVTFDRTPHVMTNAPFGFEDRVLAALERGEPPHVFSMVRNPYVRVLSAYLSKIGPRADRFVWNIFVQRFGLDSRRPLSFRDFLLLLTHDQPECMDSHFAPQVVNLAQPWLALDAIHRLEDPEPLWQWLAAKGARPEASRATNARNARAQLAEHYDATCIDLVRRIYAEDFEAFGYSPAFEDATETPPAPPPPPHPPAPRQVLLQALSPLARGRRLPPAQAAQRLNALAAALPGNTPTAWLDYVRLRMGGDRTPDCAATIAHIAKARPQDWQILQDLKAIADRAGLDSLGRDLDAMVAAACGRHRAAMPHLAYAPTVA